MSCLGLIPARGGSKGIPRKNVRCFFKKPLIEWTIEVALSTSLIDRVVVSTDDIEIAEISKAAGAEVPFLRPSELAMDSSPGISTVLHALQELPDIDDVITLQPTSPLRTVNDVEEIFSLRHLLGVQSAVSLSIASKHPSWSYSIDESKRLIPVDNSNQFFCRQDLPETFYLNGAMYLSSREFLEKKKTFIDKNTVGYIMPPERSIDIDTELDFKIAEFIIKSSL